MHIDNKYRPKERFVISNQEVEHLLAIIRRDAIIGQSSKELYYIDKIHIYKADSDAWYVTLYGEVDRRKEG